MLWLARVSPSVPPMPVHPHLADQPDVRLAEDRAASVHPLAGALPAKDALELGREPGTGRVNLARGEADLRLAERHIEPPAADRVGAPDRLGKRGLDEDGAQARRPTTGGRRSVWTTPCRRCRSMSGPGRGYPALAPAPRSGEVHRSTCSSTYTFSEHSAPCSWPPWPPWRPERRPRARRPWRTLRPRPGPPTAPAHWTRRRPGSVRRGGRSRPSLARSSRRRAGLQLVSRTRGDRFEVRGSQGWTPFYVQGVNLGVALPGRFPVRVSADSALYAGWLDTIAGMRANTSASTPSSPRILSRTPRLEPHASGARAVAGPGRLDRAAARATTSTSRRGKRSSGARCGEWRTWCMARPRSAPRPGHAGGRYDADVSPGRWATSSGANGSRTP